jgi:DNA polymerase-1
MYNYFMVKKTQKTLVLLDVHAILHRAYHALPEFESSKGEPTGALYGLGTFLIKLVKDLKPDYIIACYDLPGGTMRHEVYKDYKAGRKKIDDALIVQLERSKDVFKALNIPMYSSPGFEADDMLGTIVEKLKDNKEINVVIASGDMDTMQLINDDKVTVYTLKKGIKDTIIYNEDAVKERFGFGPEHLTDYKGLRGDTSDNIIGIKGIGEKTAEELIVNFGSIEDIYKKLKKDEEAFLKAGIKKRIIQLLKDGEEEALFSKTLATIRRDAPIHFVVPEKVWREDVEGLLIIIDEFDVVEDKSKFASLIKTLSKNKIKFLISGIAESYDMLISSHTSIQRNLANGRIKIEPMTFEEITDLFNLASQNNNNRLYTGESVK